MITVDLSVFESSRLFYLLAEKLIAGPHKMTTLDSLKASSCLSLAIPDSGGYRTANHLICFTPLYSI